MDTYPLGDVGLWTGAFESLARDEVRDTVAEIEELGWPCVWIPETIGRESLTAATLLLSATSRITVATGISSIWARDAVSAAAAHRTITEAFPERFVLGLGASHDVLVEGVRGRDYHKPYSAMAAYLAAMGAAPYIAAPPSTPLRQVLAALGPKMLKLSAEHADGAHPYLQPPEHTALAREILGPDAVLAPEQMVLLNTDADEARTIARGLLDGYLGLPNYRNSLLRLGFGEQDLDGGGSDKLIDVLVAHGGEEDIAAQVQRHRDAGATHVCVQPLTAGTGFPMREVRALAPALIGA